jgi:hypothetical protein
MAPLDEALGLKRAKPVIGDSALDLELYGDAAA